MNGKGKLNRQDYYFLIFLVLLLSAYSFHFLSFTLFDGFTTFSNDAANYVLLARKWSPFFSPSDAELFTWPVQNFPPGFPWVLAITGASETLWLSHALVSFCMICSLILAGWLTYRRLDWLMGGLLILALVSLPGVVTSSLGILSENLYLLLSLSVLMTYSYIKRKQNTTWGLYLLLSFFLTFTVLTRTIGIAIFGALFLVTLLDSELARKVKNRLYISIASSVILWQSWVIFNPQSSDLTYGFSIEYIIGSKAGLTDVLTFLWHSFNVNTMQILSSWSHYLFLTHSNLWFFLFSYIVFIVCLIGLGLRLLQLKLDSLYIVFYLIILLFWPHPGEMTRFLHPIMFLMILQPVFYFMNNPKTRDNLIVKTALLITISALIANSTYIHFHMQEQRAKQLFSNPDLSHSIEFYDFHSANTGLFQALGFANITKYMKESAQFVPLQSVVATVKPVNYSILNNRRAVNLVAVVSDMQQLCNLKIKDVDFVFLSSLTTKLNREGLSTVKKYKKISSNMWMAPETEDEVVAYTFAIDKSKLNLELQRAGYVCQAFQDHL